MNLKNGNPDLIYHVNLERDINNISSIPLSSIGSRLEYIPLETNPACMVRGISKVSVLDSLLFISDDYRLLAFDKNGRFIRKIGSEGRGPGEYLRVLDFAVNKKGKEIYLLSARQVFIYDLDGQFKRDFRISFPCSQFVLNEKDELIFHPVNIAQATDEPVYSLYFLNKNGKIKTRINNTLKRENGGIAIPISPLYFYKDILHFMEFGIDTLYRYENLIKTPYIIFQTGNLKFPPDPTINEVPGIHGKIWISDILEIKESFFIKVWWGVSISISNCLYDKLTSEFIVLKNNSFTNDIDAGISFWPKTIINDSIMVDFADAYDLIKSYKKEAKGTEQSAQLENIMKNLTETSNPVIMILYP